MIYVNIVSYIALIVCICICIHIISLYAYVYIYICDYIYIRYIGTEKVDHPISLILNPPIRDLKV